MKLHRSLAITLFVVGIVSASFVPRRTVDKGMLGKWYRINTDIHATPSSKRMVFAIEGSDEYIPNCDPNSGQGGTRECSEIEITGFDTKHFSDKEIESVKVIKHKKGSNFTKILDIQYPKHHEYNRTDTVRRVYCILSSSYDYEIIIANKYTYRLRDIETKKVLRNGNYHCRWWNLKMNGKQIAYRDFEIVKPNI